MPTDEERQCRLRRRRIHSTTRGSWAENLSPLAGPIRLSAVSDSLAARIYERARLEGEFRLRSGAVSHEYFDKYLFESDPTLLGRLSRDSPLNVRVLRPYDQTSRLAEVALCLERAPTERR